MFINIVQVTSDAVNVISVGRMISRQQPGQGGSYYKERPEGPVA